MEKKFLFGIGVTNATKEEILKYILYSLEKTKEKYYITTPNPEILVYATKNISFKAILNGARLALCDGVGVILAGKILGIPFKDRFTGVNFIENVCSEVEKKPITVGFLGGGDKVAEITAECLISRYPDLKVVFVGQEWSKEGFINESINSKFKIQNSKLQFKIQNQLNARRYTLNASVDILFVAFGFPKQEEWMHENLGRIPVRIAVGVGGSFDYISGRVARAPKFMQALGFEWLYRLIRQPWRLKRQLALLEFMLLVLKEKLSF